MKKVNKRFMRGKLGGMMLVALLFLFVTGVAFGNPFVDGTLNIPTDAQQEEGSGWDDGTWGDDGTWEDDGSWGDDAFVSECIAVTGIDEADIDFVVVPKTVPGPGEKGYSDKEFMNNILGNGFSAEKGKKSITPFWGTKEELAAGLKVYKETVSGGSDKENMKFSYTLLAGTAVEADDCSGLEEITIPEEICVEVTGVTGTDVEFIIVPADLPGPGEKGFDMNAFLEKMVGGGDLYQGELSAYYFGTEALLKEKGVKIYKYEYDKSVMESSTSMEDCLKSVKLSLIPNTTVKKTDCPEPLPEPEEICVEVTGVTGTDLEFVIVPADTPAPGEKGVTMDAFYDAVIGSGGIYEGEAFAFYSGTEEQLKTPGVKVYKYEYEYENDSTAATMDVEELLANVKLTLIPNTTVKKIQCPEPVMEDGFEEDTE